eukprot:gb/GEZN01007873.1/.p1 GENE.gb/GEZN01007873.1/~~gb/GEZN01007873.1/.p1  ORF type:complete len:391 (-),score=88.66 gb/GEZN01007873.1/:265-1437(-)
MDLDAASELADLESTELNFRKLQNGPAGGEDTISFQEARNHFSRLKLDYQDLEAQQGLLSSLVKTGVAGSEEDAIRVGELVKRNRATIQQRKQETAEIKKQLRDTIADLVHRWKEFNIQKLDFTKNFNQENTKRNQVNVAALRARNEQDIVYGKVEPEALELMSEEHCKQVLKQQAKVMEQLSQEVEQLEASFKGLEKTWLELGPSLASEERNIQQALAAEDKLTSQRKFLTQKALWTEEVRQTLCYLHGFELVPASQAELSTIRITFQHSSSQLRVELNRDHTRFTAATLVPSGEVDIGDLVSYAIKAQSMPFLVREVDNRLKVATSESRERQDSAKCTTASSAIATTFANADAMEHEIIVGAQSVNDANHTDHLQKDYVSSHQEKIHR